MHVLKIPCSLIQVMHYESYLSDIGVHMVLKIIERVSPLWGMVLTPNLRLGREADPGGVT